MSEPVIEQYDLEQGIVALVPESIRNQEPDLSIRKLVELKDKTKTAFVRAKREGSWDTHPITVAAKPLVLELLWLYSKNLDLGEKFKSGPVHAETVLGLCINPQFNLPEEVQLCASALKSKFESFNWGIVDQSNVAEDEGAGTGGPTLSSKRKAAAIEDNDSEESSEERRVFVNARDDHPIFGVNGCMHDIQMSKGGIKKSYRVRPGYASRDFRTSGDNGLTVGDCWPRQIAALRDGAHGNPVKGISGTLENGVYSIIVSNKYSDVDHDEGDELYYAAADAHTTKAAVADRSSQGTQALMKSLATRNSIRVFRKEDSASEYAPKAGLRYDGLYTITAAAEHTNDQGGKYLRFRLVRKLLQPPIDVNRPSAAEIRDFRKARNGF